MSSPSSITETHPRRPSSKDGLLRAATVKPCADCPDDGMRVASWIVWCDDGNCYEGSTAEEWAALPDDGLLGVKLLYDREGYGRNASGADYYFRAEGILEPIYGHSNGPWQDIVVRYTNVVIKRGRWTDDAYMRAVAQAMI